MSKISEYLQSILSAVYGRDVRQSIHDAIEQCYDDVTAGKTKADTAANAAQNAADNVSDAVNMASTAAENANAAAESAGNATENANESANAANEAANKANQSASDADRAADQANAAANTAAAASESANSAAANAAQAANDANAATDEASNAASNANMAAGDANDAANAAKTATGLANTAAENANAAAELAESWGDATMETVTLESGEEANVKMEVDEDGKRVITIGVPKGATGAMPVLTFKVATGEPGTQVQMEQTGTPEAPIINLTIPRGDTGAVDGVDYYTGTPSALGEASPGTANGLARGDHVHPKPTAEEIGARPDNWMPSAKEIGAVESVTANGQTYTADKDGNINLGTIASEGGAEYINELLPDPEEESVEEEGVVLPVVADHAKNAEQLNGKSAEYYTNPRNLLDNSDFRNPVNQRGQTSYSGNGNTIDRWNIFSGEGLSDVTLTVNDGYITIESPHAYSGIGQNIPIKDGVYTFAYKVKDGGIIISNGWYSTSIGAYHVEMYVGTGGVLNLEWAALYEGTYTADNLPPYVPKGYAAELAECRRYFYRIKNTRANGFSIFCWGLAESESKFYPQIAIPFGMREDVVASISHNADLRAYYLNSDGLAAVANITEITASSGSATGTITLTVTVEGAPFQKGYHVAIQFADTGYIDVSKDL